MQRVNTLANGNRVLRRSWLSLLFMMSASAAWANKDAGDWQRGKQLAEVRCGVCHHLQHQVTKVGPGLLGVYNRPPTIDGIPFARWDSDALDQWLHQPRSVKPNTRMTFSGITREQDRRDIISYLKTLQ